MMHYESFFTIFSILFFISIAITYFKSKRKIFQDFKIVITKYLFILLLLKIITISILFNNIKIPMLLIVIGLIFKLAYIYIIMVFGIELCEKNNLKFNNKININFDKKTVIYMAVFLFINLIISNLIFSNFIIKQSEYSINLLNSIFILMPPTNGIIGLIILIISQLPIAIEEEILYRLGLQNLVSYILKLHNSNYILAVLISSFFFALSHYPNTDSPFLKILQIFPIGIGLGLIFKKYGLEASIVSHWTFNIIVGFINNYILNSHN
mgnify:CR=1 FL=1